MVTIKSCTDLSHGKTLSKILPLESADMYWWSSGKRYYIEAMDDGDFNKEEGHVRAWSLAALLNVLPLPDLIQDRKDGKLFWKCCVYDKYITSLCETRNNNPIDACYEMIIKLYEMNLL